MQQLTRWGSTRTNATCFRNAPAVVLLAATVVLAGCAGGPRWFAANNPEGPQASPASTAAMDGMTDGYRIGPEDMLEISVWREEELQREVLVRPDGRISFPLAGDVQAAGRTAEQVAEEVTARLDRYIPDPVVTVSVKEVAGYKIYVLGQVARPGEYMVGRYVDVMQALTLAGGLTPYASRNQIRILRREDGREVVLPFRYVSVQRGEDLSQNVMLQSGDVVVVP
jgi:polysaccharide biosynthesis/export protein